MAGFDKPRAGGGGNGSGTMALLRNLLVAAAAIAPSIGVGGIGGPDAPTRAPERTNAPPAALARVAFEENRGQAAPSVRFVGRGRGVVALVDDRGADLLLGRGAGIERARLVIGGAAPSRPAAVGAPLPGPAHYLSGSDPSKWVRGVPRFRSLRAASVAPGADLAWRGSEDGRLAFDLHLAPGTDPASVPISLPGARALAIDGEGRLVASLNRGDLVLGRPSLWQESARGRVPVDGRYALRGAGAVVTAGAFDRSLPLVVDPTLEYGSYLGGAGDDAGFAARTDANGVLCVAGTSTGSFQTVNPYDSTVSGSWDTVVAKVSADGADLLYATYLGGSGTDTPRDLAVSAAGAIVVVGETTSTNFPVANAIQDTGVIGSGMPQVPEAYASRLSSDGGLLEWSTYLGGTGAVDVAYGVAIDASGNAFVVG
ncbi:MAG TPA: SBBP repeat-containing protein, partial [Planctomycetota bacterium]|nr:SBBP repeat-containing protein [Planctomycetota bacterium]